MFVKNEAQYIIAWVISSLERPAVSARLSSSVNGCALKTASSRLNMGIDSGDVCDRQIKEPSHDALPIQYAYIFSVSVRLENVSVASRRLIGVLTGMVCTRRRASVSSGLQLWHMLSASAGRASSAISSNDFTPQQGHMYSRTILCFY